MKSAGNIFVSILLADLVFLHTLWQLLKFAVDYLFLNKLPDAHYCSGCSSVARSKTQRSPGDGFERLGSAIDLQELTPLKSDGVRTRIRHRQTSEHSLMAEEETEPVSIA